MNKLAAIALVLSAAAACVPAPKKAYSADEVKALDDISELMRVNAATMDPLFSVENDTTYDDATFARMREASTKIQATGTALQKPSIAGKYPEGFVDHAKTLTANAEKLGAAASAKDAPGAGASVRAIHAACKECHSEMR